MASKKAKYPNRIYSTKQNALIAMKKYGGKSVKRVELPPTLSGRAIKGWGIVW